MVDGDAEQATPRRLRPGRSEEQQGHGVAAARQGERDRVADIAFKPRIQPRHDPAFQPGRWLGDQLQLARVRVSAAMARRAGVEVA